MYIKNIGELIKDQLPLKLRFFEGNSIHGKLISLEDGKGAIKLYDGTIIPAIFVNENNLEKNKFTKFVIQGIDGENLLLKAFQFQDDISDEKSIEWILKDLNIPLDKGKDIISSLLKFNIPASDGNINSIYKNVKFLENLTAMSDPEILTFLQNNVDSNIAQNSNEFVACKQILSLLKDVNCDFLTFLVQNDIPLNIENILKTKDFVDNKFFMNSLIDDLKQNIIQVKPEILNSIKNLGEFKNDNELFNFVKANIDKDIVNGSDKFNNIKLIINTLNNPEIVDTLSSIDIFNNKNENITINGVKFNKELVIDILGKLNIKNQEQSDLLHSTLESNKYTPKQEIKIDEFLNKIKESLFTGEQQLNDTLNNIKTTLKLNDDSEVFSFIKTNIDKDIVSGSDKFNNIKQIINILNDPKTVDTLSSRDIVDTKNEFININNFKFSKSLFIEVLSKLDNNIKIYQPNIDIVSLNDMIKAIQHNPETLKDLSSDSIKNFINNIDILKNIDKNYNFYHFNLYNNQDVLKNTIIIKNKYRSSKYIDVNDVRVFISVDTLKLGTIEGYLYKKYNDLFISLNTHEDNIKFIKDNLPLLKSALSSKGYNIIDISVDKVVSEFDIVNLSTFFNDGIFNELDVKV